MKPVFLICGIACVLLLSTQSPSIASAQTNSNIEESYRATLLALIDVLQQQISILQAELQRQQPAVETSPTSVNNSGGTEVVAVYDSDGPTSVATISQAQHRAYFSRVYELFPIEYSSKLTRLRVFSGEEGLFDAFVGTIPPEHETWQYSVHERALKDVDSLWGTELIVHELGHIIAYEAVPGRENFLSDTCHVYFKHHGCPPYNSYFDHFVEEFWSDVDLRRAVRSTDADEALVVAQAHYERNQTKYVTEYAALNPEEDFSESFMYFVLNKEVEGTVADEKIAFFTRYAKLKSVREQIRNQL